MCADHGDHIDKNRGTDYPAHVLLSWKAAHEFRIAREHGQSNYAFGWISKLTISDRRGFQAKGTKGSE
jgi:hypothetical protein